MNKNQYQSLGITLLIGIIIWFLPHPAEISNAGWHILAIFVATIVGIIIKAMPIAALSILAISVATVTKTLTIDQALSSFSRDSIWLIVTAFFISRGFIKTGLGKRIGYFFIRLFGKTSLGLAYSLTMSETVLASGIPSVTARSGGIIYPIVDAVSQSLGSQPNHPTSTKIGKFLILVCFQASIISSAMFLTAMAANPGVRDLAAGLGINISAGRWALAACIPGIVSLIIVPLVVYMLAKPELKALPNAVELAKTQMQQMGRMSRQEIIMLGTFIMLVTLWVLGDALGINTTTTAFFGVTVLLVTDVLSLDDLLKEKGAWDTYIWFGALITLASYLNNFGVIGYFSGKIAGSAEGMNWMVAMVGLALIYFYSHYFFASSMAHVGAMYAAFLMVAIKLGAPAMMTALLLAFISNLFGGLTHYGIGNAPVLFGSGYVSLKDWWKTGFIVSVVNIAIWLGLGSLWWPFIESRNFFGL